MTRSYKFNLRVYALIINDEGKVLVANEIRAGIKMSKFPGGGLKYGEGTLDCLKRELFEELGIKIQTFQHFYTTDFYQKSVFDDSQVISVYYLCKTEVVINNLNIKSELESVEWLAPTKLLEDKLTFPIDKKVAELLEKIF
jgi:8-oxo-dGTP diphosphatase